jgi:Tol biopolymer transport system component
MYLAAGLIVVAAIILALAARVAPAPMPETSPFTSLPGIENQPAFSPDGDRLAFTWNPKSTPAVYTENLKGEHFQRLTQSNDREYFPVWSPDGKELAFLRKTASDRMEIRIVAASGGEDRLIAGIVSLPSTAPGLSWSPDGNWLITAEATGQGDAMRLVLFSPRSGARQIFQDSGARTGYLYPSFSQDGKYVAYVKNPDVGVNDVFVAGFPNGHERQITSDHAIIRGLAWAGPHDLIVSSTKEGRQDTLWRIPLSGGAAGRLTEGTEASLFPTVSPADGSIAFSHKTDDVNLWRRPLDSKDPGDAGKAWIAATGLDSSPQFSPDGTRLALRSSRSGQSEIWIAENDGRTARRLTHFAGPLTGSPHWSPDGRWIVFDSRASGNSDIWYVSPDGGTPRPLTSSAANEVVPSFSRDGRFVYYSSDADGAWNVWRKPWNSGQGGPAEKVRERAFAATESPDGRYLYYARGPNEAGLFRAPVAGGAETAVVAGLTSGMWGNWVAGASGVYFVDWVAEGSVRQAWAQYRPESGETQRLFRLEQPIRWDGGLAVSPDGKSLVYAQLDRIGSDIYLMRHWR